MLVPVRPRYDHRQGCRYDSSTALHTALRDNFTIPTWLLLGATAQSLVYLLMPLKYAVCPVGVVLLWKILDTGLTVIGVKRNRQMDGVIMGKFSAQVPDKRGVFPEKAAGHGVVLMLLSARSNHPLGIFSPGYKKLGDYMGKMQNQLAEDSEKFGYLGHTSWIEANGRATANAVMTATYFRTVEDLHNYAHSPLHTEVWRWWNSISKTHPHLSITHEMYYAPEDCWETIYANCHPVGLAGTETKIKVADGSDGPEYQWVGSIVDATSGGMSTQYGRLNKTDGSENVNKFGVEPY